MIFVLKKSMNFKESEFVGLDKMQKQFIIYIKSAPKVEFYHYVNYSSWQTTCGLPRTILGLELKVMVLGRPMDLGKMGQLKARLEGHSLCSQSDCFKRHSIPRQ